MGCALSLASDAGGSLTRPGSHTALSLVHSSLSSPAAPPGLQAGASSPVPTPSPATNGRYRPLSITSPIVSVSTSTTLTAPVGPALAQPQLQRPSIAPIAPNPSPTPSNDIHRSNDIHASASADAGGSGTKRTAFPSSAVLSDAALKRRQLAVTGNHDGGPPPAVASTSSAPFLSVVCPISYPLLRADCGDRSRDSASLTAGDRSRDSASLTVSHATRGESVCAARSVSGLVTCPSQTTSSAAAMIVMPTPTPAPAPAPMQAVIEDDEALDGPMLQFDMEQQVHQHALQAGSALIPIEDDEALDGPMLQFNMEQVHQQRAQGASASLLSGPGDGVQAHVQAADAYADSDAALVDQPALGLLP